MTSLCGAHSEAGAEHQVGGRGHRRSAVLRQCPAFGVADGLEAADRDTSFPSCRSARAGGSFLGAAKLDPLPKAVMDVAKATACDDRGADIPSPSKVANGSLDMDSLSRELRHSAVSSPASPASELSPGLVQNAFRDAVRPERSVSPGSFAGGSINFSELARAPRQHRASLSSEPHRPRVLPSLQIGTRPQFSRSKTAREVVAPCSESQHGHDDCHQRGRQLHPDVGSSGCGEETTAQRSTCGDNEHGGAEKPEGRCGGWFPRPVDAEDARFAMAITAEVSRLESGSAEVTAQQAEDCQASSVVVASCLNNECGKCRLCQAFLRTHRRDSVLSIDFKDASHRISSSSCSTAPGNFSDVRPRSSDSALSGATCLSSTVTPKTPDYVPGGGAHQSWASQSCSSAGADIDEVRVSDGDVDASDQGSRCSSVAPSSQRETPDSPASPLSPLSPGRPRRSRADSFLRVPSRRNTLSRLEVPTTPRSRRFSLPFKSHTVAVLGQSSHSSINPPPPSEPITPKLRRPSEPAVPSCQLPDKAAKRLSLALPAGAILVSNCRPCIAEATIEEDCNVIVDDATNSRVSTDNDRGRKKKPSLDLSHISPKHNGCVEDLSECPLESIALPAPQESPKSAGEVRFVERLQAKLEREALLRETSDPHGSFAPSEDEDDASCVSGQAPDGDCVPMPSPMFLSRDNTPRDLTPRHASINSSRGGDASPWPLTPGDQSPRGSYSFHIQTESLDDAKCEDKTCRPELRLERDFQPGETIGHGSFGRVFSARHRVSGQIIAVKEMLLEEHHDKEQSNIRQKRLDRELRLCEQLRHERVVRYFGHEYASRGCSGTCQRLFLFLEFCSGGSVASHLRTFGALDEPLLGRYALQLLEGLKYLHSLTPAVVHRDLKCANLLLTHDAHVKIADFGCSKWLWESDNLCEEEAHNSMVGSVFWTAPEVLRGGGEITVAVDYWSFGCCVLEMATAKHPWSEHQFDNIWQACRLIVYSDKLPEVSQELSTCIQDTIYACLRRAPAERPTADALMSFPLLCSTPVWAPTS